MAHKKMIWIKTMQIFNDIYWRIYHVSMHPFMVINIVDEYPENK